MKKILLLLIVFAANTIHAQHFIVDIKATPEQWKQVNMTLNGIDHFSKKGGSYIVTLSTIEIDKIKSSVDKISVLKGPLEEEIQFRLSNPSKNTTRDTLPPYFKKGSLLGNLSYTEALEVLDSLRFQYPNLISEQIEFGRTIENRPLFYIKISNSAPTKSSFKTNLLFTALHHAREPLSMMQMLYFMCDFLSKAKPGTGNWSLLNQADLYFVPFLNVDGYLFNEENKDSGNIFWRKNRRANLDGSFGVDLNRNYDAYWGLDESGSSSNPISETFRGTSAFSEPETQALKALSESINPKGVLNFHSYGNLLLYPYSYQEGMYTNDDFQFRRYAQSMTFENQYIYGTSWEVLYAVNGGADDWQFDRNMVDPTFSFTPEVGEAEEGFWPNEEKIIPYCEDNLALNYAFINQMTELIDGIETQTQTTLAKIFNDKIQVYFKGKVSIYSTIGQTLFFSQVNENEWIDLSNFKNQLIIIEYLSPTKKLTKKLYIK